MLGLDIKPTDTEETTYGISKVEIKRPGIPVSL